ncbi:MAG TPA: DUF4124 domain-containing protein [Nevskiaceae bacterium]|nr:DUF4124 domain-containing protein [Nevskiaceae bacterium]
MNKWLFIAMLLAAGTADAGVHKCKTPEGKITYTDRGCPQGQDVAGRDQGGTQGSSKDAAKATNAQSSGRQDFYRESVKSAEQSGPKP